MKLMHAVGRPVTAVALAILALPILGGMLGNTPALATLGPCRSDPVVTLSNLKTLDLSATIYDASSDLRGVTYTMHVPRGVSALVVIGTDGLVGQVEHFKIVCDQPQGKYVVTTEVSTGSNVSVTADAVGLLIGSGSVSGMSNQDLNLNLQ